MNKQTNKINVRLVGASIFLLGVSAGLLIGSQIVWLSIFITGIGSGSLATVYFIEKK